MDLGVGLVLLLLACRACPSRRSLRSSGREGEDEEPSAMPLAALSYSRRLRPCAVADGSFMRGGHRLGWKEEEEEGTMAINPSSYGDDDEAEELRTPYGCIDTSLWEYSIEPT
ncbi:hypothetical protein GUJ93_ZPchr0001g31564 [Zizania palustris]|uniref:Uncharacterized protein n=1 Tax=Zizania palustris TaxID=103762 RepID=A0A8J5V0V4_ZIZPA|nr:hypothetical protein GUJ93_ZPchr0001g31564 [Zizania palustris]